MSVRRVGMDTDLFVHGFTLRCWHDLWFDKYVLVSVLQVHEVGV